MNSELTSRYPGLEPFRTEQQAVFFGREAELERLHDLVQAHQQVLLYAKSGLGKSSLLNAGLVPRLHARAQATGERIRVLPIRFGSWVPAQSPTPLDVVHAALGPVPMSYLDRIIPEEGSLWQHCKALSADGEDGTLYLVFDQFEELFSHPAESMVAFKRQLADLLYREVPQHFRTVLELLQDMQPDLLSAEEAEHFHEPLRVKVVYAIREDRYHELNLLTDYLPDITHHRFLLEPLNRSQAEEAIVKPAASKDEFRSTPFTYAPNALSKILDYLSSGEQHTVETTQLQVLCSHFERLGKAVVTVDDIPAFDDVFLQFYLESIAALPEELQPRAREFIEDYMIIEGKRIGYHRLACLEYLPAEALEVLLSERHLLRAERGSTGETLELSHDTLVAPILTAKVQRELEEEAMERQRQEEVRLQEAERERQQQEEERLKREEAEKRERVRVEEENRKLQALVEEKEQARAMEVFARKKEEEARAQEAKAKESLRKQLRRARIFLAVAVLASLAAIWLSIYAKRQAENAQEKEQEALKQQAEAVRQKHQADSLAKATQVAYKELTNAQIKQLDEKYKIVQKLDQDAAKFLVNSMWALDSTHPRAIELHQIHPR